MVSRCAALLLVSLALASCGTTDAGGDSNTARAPESLAEARSLWADRAVATYQVTVQQTCYCPPDLRQPLRVSVSEGEVTGVEGMEQPLNNEDQLDHDRLTVTGLFRFIEESAAKDPHKLEVDYDTRYGFPRRIDYDEHEMIADDEFQYRLTDFRAGSPD